MASTVSITERIEGIDSFDDTIPYLRALPLNIIKMFLSSSAKHGFFDNLDLNEIENEDDNESPSNDSNPDSNDEIKVSMQNEEEEQNTDESPPPTLPTNHGPKPCEYVFKLNKSNKRLFSTTNHGTTLVGSFKRDYKYPSNDWRNNVKNLRFGTAIFGKFFQRPTKITVHIRVHKNCVNNAVGFGFIGMRHNQYVMKSRDEYNNHCVLLYGDGQCFASQAFSDEEEPIDCVLDSFVNFFSVGDTVVLEMDLKSDKAMGKIYNLDDVDNLEKQFVTPLKTYNIAIGVTMNVMFKPSLSVIRQFIE